MHFTSTARLGLLTVSLVLAVLPAATAAPSRVAPALRPDHPVVTDRTQAAEQALRAVQAAFEQDRAPRARTTGRGTDLTIPLRELRRSLADLTPADRQLARRYLARPTDGSEPYGAAYSRRARPTSDCVEAPTRRSKVCVHWARRTIDAPPRRDADSDGLPNQVELTRDVMNRAWRRIVAAGGYKAPLPDGRRGGNGKLDVYLVDIGGQGLFGFCATEKRVSGRAFSGYCVLDDDYAAEQYNTRNTPIENLQVTAAHEFFHAVQFAYDAWADAWLMESTSTWVEDEIFDAVNDNVNYLNQSILAAPEIPLDYSGGLFVYGNWIWWRYLTESFPRDGGTGLPLIVREVWQRLDHSGRGGTYSMRALHQELAQRGRRLSAVFGLFAAANQHPESFYSEAVENGYEPAPFDLLHRLSPGEASVQPRTVRLDHMTSGTVVFQPESGFDGAGSQLRVVVDLPDADRDPVAVLTTVATAGQVTSQLVPVSAGGAGELVVPFRRGEVRQVELTLVNGGHDYRCWSARTWSCEGVPLDQDLPFGYSAEAQDLAQISAPSRR